MHNRNRLAHKPIATPQEEREMRDHVLCKLKKQRPLLDDSVSTGGTRFPKDWRLQRNDLLAETP